MSNGIKLGAGSLYISDGETFKTLGGVEELYVGVDYANGEDEHITTISNGGITLTIKPTYKKWFKKKKGNRYIYSYKLKVGFDLKVINKLFGGE